MGPTWGLSAPGGPHVDPISLAIRESTANRDQCAWYVYLVVTNHRQLDCLSNGLFRFSRNISKLPITGPWGEFTGDQTHRWRMGSPHKGPEMWKFHVMTSPRSDLMGWPRNIAGDNLGRNKVEKYLSELQTVVDNLSHLMNIYVKCTIYTLELRNTFLNNIQERVCSLFVRGSFYQHVLTLMTPKLRSVKDGRWIFSPPTSKVTTS